MRKTILFIAFFAMISHITMAQAPQKGYYNKGGFNKDKLDSIKTIFIAKHIGLTDQQSSSFWTIYNKYEAERKSLRKDNWEGDNYKKNLDDLSNTDADKVINNYFLLKAKELELSQKYISEFKKVLDAKQVAKLITSENQFKNMLIKYGQNKPNMYKNPGLNTPPKN